jgi:hypothetical protein
LQYVRWFSFLEKKASSMSMVGFPLLLIPIAIYNIIAFLMPGVSFTDRLFKAKLVSGTEWTVSFGDCLVALGVLMLLLEVIKGARPGAKYLTDHILSLLVFGAAAAEFLMWSKFASSTYFLLTLLAMTDFLSGIALRTRHGVQVPAAATAAIPAEVEPADTPVPHPAAIDLSPAFEAHPDREAQTASEPWPAADAETEVEAQPAAEVASAASIAESVLMDHPEPKLAREPKIA